MAKHLDLEEQEQIDQIKHFWRQYGNVITWALIVVLGAFAAWNGYHWWERSQAAKSAALYDEVERAARSGDQALLERSFGDMRDRYGRTTYAQQAGLLAAKVWHDKGNAEAAKGALAWVADKGSDAGYQAIARLRLAGLLIEAKAYDEALAQLTSKFPAEFAALAADRKGDVYRIQDKKSDARAAYEQAYRGLEEGADYRRLVEVKLNALGVDPRATAPSAASGGSK